MKYSSMFQNVKHKGYVPSRNEISDVRAFLGRDSAIYEEDSHAALYLLCMFSDSRSSDYFIVSSFLAKDANDYARASALHNIIHNLNITDQDVKEYVKCVLRNLDIEKSYETIIRAFSGAIHIYDNTKDAEIMKSVCESYKAVFNKYISGDYLYGSCLLSFFDISCIDARSGGFDFRLASSIDYVANNSEKIIHYLSTRPPRKIA